MKNFCISFCLLLIILLLAVGNGLFINQEVEYLRIHVRADSNLKSAQDVKYLVKDGLVEYLTPKLANCKTKKRAEEMLRENLSELENIANDILLSNGFTYKSTITLKSEQFPTRSYGELTLEQGYYDALIVNLGSGEGDNWWCVVYPPLCFVSDGTPCVYKSKLLEIINEFFKNKEEGK